VKVNGVKLDYTTLVASTSGAIMLSGSLAQYIGLFSSILLGIILGFTATYMSAKSQKRINQLHKKEMMKTATISIDAIKDEGWTEICYTLLYDDFRNSHKDLDEDEVNDLFQEEVVYKKFEHGEYGNITLIVDQNFNIIGGKIN